MNFSEKFADANNPKAGKKYVLNGKEISSDEYAAFASKIFAAEESTDWKSDFGYSFLLLKVWNFRWKNHRNVLYWQKHEDKGQETWKKRLPVNKNE